MFVLKFVFLRLIHRVSIIAFWSAVAVAVIYLFDGLPIEALGAVIICVPALIVVSKLERRHSWLTSQTRP